MEFVNKKLKCKFSLPDPLCLRHIEEYETARDSARTEGAQFSVSVNWVGAVALIKDWTCEALPKPDDLTPEALKDVYGVVLQIVVWVGGQVAAHVMSELFVPKN